MTRAAQWTKHRPLALAIARDYRIPGLDPDDVRQEALVALWEATGAWDREQAPLPAFARLVIHRHLIGLLKAATRLKRTAILDHETEPTDQRDRLAARLELVDLARSFPLLTELEREALAAVARGEPGRDKQHYNAVDRARAKLRSAA